MTEVFRVVGLDELVVGLESEAALAPSRARVVVQDTAKKVTETMKQMAPVDEGELRDSITYSTKLFGSGAKGAGAEAEIGPEATRDGYPYPIAVEYGTSKMAPEPYAGPALDKHADEFVQGIANEVSKL